MCWFVTVASPSEEVLRAVLRSCFGLVPVRAGSAVLRELPGWSAFLVTEGSCSCGLYADPGAAERDVEVELQRFRRRHRQPRHRKRGWTEARIEGEAAALRARRLAAAPRRSGLRADLGHALDEVCERAGGVAVVAHWYRGDVDREDPVREVVTVATIDPASLPPDVLHVRTGDPAGG